MNKFKVGDRVKDVSRSAPSNPYGIVKETGENSISLFWDGDVEYTPCFFHEDDFSLVARLSEDEVVIVADEFTINRPISDFEVDIEPWNLLQVSIHDKDRFKETLVKILEEGRKLTPCEIVKVQDFLGMV